MPKKKHRSPSYPAIDLEVAIGLARRVYPAAKHALGADVIAKEWDYKGLSSASPRIAALKHFGLFTEENGGKDRMLRLSDLAFHIMVDPEYESAMCREAIKKAALNPSLHSELWGKWADELPPDGEIRRYLERERNFNPNYVERFIQEYKATISFAQLSGEEIGHDSGGNESASCGDSPSVGDYIQWNQQGIAQFSQPRRVVGLSDDGRWVFVEGSKSGIPVNEIAIQDASGLAVADTSPPANPFFQTIIGEPPAAGVKRDVFTLAEGEAVLEWPEGLSANSYEDLEGWLELMLRKIKRSTSSS